MKTKIKILTKKVQTNICRPPIPELKRSIKVSLYSVYETFKKNTIYVTIFISNYCVFY